MLPTEVTAAEMEEELPSISAWADRHDWTVAYDPMCRTGTVTALHPVTNATVTFHFNVDGYPAQAPAWWCGAPPDGREEGAGSAPVSTHAAFPAPGSGPIGAPAGSIFHSQPVICAPWNRLAYQIHGGPHGDWGTPADWKKAGAGYTQAHTIADMLSSLQIHLQYSPGMQG